MTWWTCLLADESPFPQRRERLVQEMMFYIVPPPTPNLHDLPFLPVCANLSNQLSKAGKLFNRNHSFFFFVYEKYKQCGKIVLPLFCFCTYINPVNRVIPSEDRVYSHIASSVFLVWQNWCSTRCGRVITWKTMQIYETAFPLKALRKGVVHYRSWRLFVFLEDLPSFIAVVWGWKTSGWIWGNESDQLLYRVAMQQQWQHGIHSVTLIPPWMTAMREFYFLVEPYRLVVFVLHMIPQPNTHS